MGNLCFLLASLVDSDSLVSPRQTHVSSVGLREEPSRPSLLHLITDPSHIMLGDGGEGEGGPHYVAICRPTGIKLANLLMTNLLIVPSLQKAPVCVSTYQGRKIIQLCIFASFSASKTSLIASTMVSFQRAKLA